MKTSDWLIPRLRELNGEREALIAIPERIQTLKLSFGAIRAARTDGDPVSGGTYRREDALLANIAERDRLRQNLEVTRREVEQLERALKKLSEDERLIIDRFYIDRPRDHVERLCEELHLEKSQVYELKNRALISLARALYGQVNL